jgi:hypothetical protein
MPGRGGETTSARIEVGPAVIAWPAVHQHHRGTVTAPLVRKTESVHGKGVLHGMSMSVVGLPALDRRPLC